MDTIETMERAMQLLASGDANAAESACREVLAHESDNPDALYVLGVIAHQRARHREALDLIERAIAIEPTAHWYYIALAEAHSASGSFDAAVAALHRSLEIEPNQPAVGAVLSKLLVQLGRHEEHIEMWRMLSKARPDDPEVFIKYGNALLALHRSEAAAEPFAQALKLSPASPAALCGSAIALADQRHFEEALHAANRAIEIEPTTPDTHYTKGIVLRAWKKFDEAIAAFERAIEIQPRFLAPRKELAKLLELEGCIAQYREILRLSPGDKGTPHNLLFNLNYLPDISTQELFEAHRDWARQHVDPLLAQTRPHTNSRDRQRRLRVGYLSGELRYHPVAMFLKPILEHHRSEQFRTTCFAAQGNEDEMTRQLQDLSDDWQVINGLRATEAAELIRSSEIDILIDLSGHSGKSQLEICALKPAPVQMTYLGYCNTSGMAAMDYIFGDEITDPPGATQPYVEQLIRLPGCFSCYAPLADAPEPNALPALSNGYITLISLHTLRKLNPAVLDLWTRVLNEVPTAKLLIWRDRLTEREQSRLRAQFNERGVRADRFIMRNDVEATDRMKLSVLHHGDIALDAFPWSGHTTSCNAMWMGVPFITLPGHNHAARMAASAVTHAGFPEFVAQDEADYIRIIKLLASDLPRLSLLRQTMRKRMSKSRLCDGDKFIVGWEEALRNAWKTWCARAAQ